MGREWNDGDGDWEVWGARGFGGDRLFQFSVVGLESTGWVQGDV